MDRPQLWRSKFQHLRQKKRRSGSGSSLICNLVLAIPCGWVTGFSCALVSPVAGAHRDSGLPRRCKVQLFPNQVSQETMEDDDDVPQLSAHALAALQEFMREHSDQPADDAIRGAEYHDGDGDGDGDVTLLSEDWRMSQFWYDEATSACVAAEVNHLVASRPQCRVACIACPTLFVELKKRYPGVSAQLFEYDQRFKKYGSKFTFYDYNSPLDVPQEHHKAFQLVVADPPYLSKECLEKTVETMRLIAAADSEAPTLFMVLTGAVQVCRVWELLKARPCVFRPVHQNKLGNEFMLFTNYDPLDRFGGWENITRNGKT